MVRRRLKAQVAPAAVTALGDHEPLSDLGHISDDGFFVFVNQFGSDRNTQHDIVARLTGALTTHAMLTILREKVLLITKVDKSVQTCDGLGYDCAAIATVATIWATVFDEFLAPEGYATTATATGTDIDLREIEEFHVISAFWRVLGSDSLLRAGPQGFPAIAGQFHGRGLCCGA